MLSVSLLVPLSFLLCVLSVVSAVPVKYGLCNTNPSHLTILTVESDEWPPKKGEDLSVTFNGTMDETVTSGEYTVGIKFDGFPLPSSSGDINDVHPLPWNKGPIAFTFPVDFPASAPSGSYSVTVSAKEQTNTQLFCVELNFNLLEELGNEEASNANAFQTLRKTWNRHKRSIKMPSINLHNNKAKADLGHGERLFRPTRPHTANKDRHEN